LARVELESLRRAPGWNSLDEGKLQQEFWTVAAREFINARRMISLRVAMTVRSSRSKGAGGEYQSRWCSNRFNEPEADSHSRGQQATR
jgi:hypothetical protein